MTHSPLQSPQASAYLPCKVRLHSQPDGNISFRHSISIRGNSREAHSDDAIMLGNLGYEINPQRVCAVIEDDDDFIAVSDFADRPHSDFLILRTVQ